MQFVPHLCFLQIGFYITNNITILACLFCRFWILYRAKQDGPVVLVNHLYLYFFFFTVGILCFELHWMFYRVGAILGRAMAIILMSMNMNMNMRYLLLHYNSFLLKVSGWACSNQMLACTLSMMIGPGSNCRTMQVPGYIWSDLDWSMLRNK